jgi:hypothetical protein
MRLSVMVFGLVCVCALVIATAAPFTQDEDVRGAFIASRKEKTASTGGTTTVSRRKPRSGGNTNSSNKPVVVKTDKPVVIKSDKTTVKPDNKPTPSAPVTPVNVSRLGLGVTLFMRDSNGLAVRTDPGHVFRRGDRVRILLETNADGYLYIFNATNDGPASMIYPDAELDEGGNYLQAHVPFEIPSTVPTDERLRWFAFDEIAGTERLFFVFTREPISGIPIDDELLALCRDTKERCPFKPTPEVWALVQKELQEPLKTDKSQQYGRAQTNGEQQATTRGIGLSKDDPGPSLVLMASATRPTLVATLDLIHK